MIDKHWNKYLWGFFIFVCLQLVACNHFNRSIKDDVVRLYSSKIIIPTEYMQLLDSCVVDSMMKTVGDIRMIVYTDSTECSPCALKQLGYGTQIVDSLMMFPKFRGSIFIFSPLKTDCGYFEQEIKKINIPFPVYIDTCHIFAKENGNIPSNKMMHTFLIDEEGKVVLVGNPLANKQIEDLFYSYLKDLK